MADRLILVRHAKPSIASGTPSAHWTLSPEGREAAASPALRLPPLDLTAILSSPEPKARETADALAAHLSVPVQDDPDFAEHARPEAGFLDRDAFLAAIAALFERPGEVVFGSESADAAFARFSAAINRHRQPGRDLLVATHGTVMTLYLSRTLGFAPLPFWRGLTMPAAVIIDSAGMHMVPLDQ